MLGFIAFELALLVGLWIVFIALMTFHRPNGRVRIVRWWREPFSSQLVGIALVGLIESAALFAAATGHRPSLWVFVGIFGAIDIITARWLWLIWRARKRPLREEVKKDGTREEPNS